MPQPLTIASISVKPRTAVMIILHPHPAQVASERILKRFNLENPTATDGFPHTAIHHRPKTTISGNGQKLDVRRRVGIGRGGVLEMSSVPHGNSFVRAHPQASAGIGRHAVDPAFTQTGIGRQQCEVCADKAAQMFVGILQPYRSISIFNTLPTRKPVGGNQFFPSAPRLRGERLASEKTVILQKNRLLRRRRNQPATGSRRIFAFPFQGKSSVAQRSHRTIGIYPQRSLAVHIELTDTRAGERGRVLRIKRDKTPPIKSRQAVVSAYPQVAIGRLCNGRDGTVRQPIVGSPNISQIFPGKSRSPNTSYRSNQNHQHPKPHKPGQNAGR